MNTISGASAAPASVQFGRRNHADSPSAHSPVRAAAHRTRLDQPEVDRLPRDLFERAFRDMAADNHESNAPSLGEVRQTIHSSDNDSSGSDSSDNDEATVPAASAEPDGNHESDGSSSDEDGTAHHLMAARRFASPDDLQSRLE